MTRALRFGLIVGSLVSSAALLAQSTPARPPEPLKSVVAEDAPKAIGPYSQAIVAGGFLFAAGQIPIDAKTGELVSGGIEQSTERVFDNLQAVLRAEGLSFADVVKTTVYLTRSEDFPAMNGVYGRRMGESRPARSTVIVASLPKSAPLEIELIARTKK